MKESPAFFDQKVCEPRKNYHYVNILSEMNTDVTPLIRHMQRFVNLSKDEIKLIGERFSRRPLKNKEYLLRENEVCAEKYFIVTGCLRKYINTEGGDKQLFQFSIENWWMTDYTSLESGKPSSCNIQAVENSEIIFITKENLDRLFHEVPAMETYFRKILQRAYEASLHRVHLIFSYTGEERYRHFTDAFPDFVQRIPQYMLASYLGFTPEYLSKLRAKRKFVS